MRIWVILMMALLGAARVDSQTPVGETGSPPEGGDGLVDDVALPPDLREANQLGPTARAGILSAVAADRHMVVRWTPPRSVAGALGAPVIHASTDNPGRRVMRDWREWPMHAAAGGTFEARIPLQSIDVPTAYILSRTVEGGTEASHMRAFWPRQAGLTEPTDVFTGFIDGFEAGLSGWELVSSAAVIGAEESRRIFRLSTNSLSGRAALRVEIPKGRGSVTVGTVRIRGWMLTTLDVDAIRVAARTESGSGRLGCALHSRARTGSEELAVHPAHGEFQVGTSWQRLEVPVPAFVGVRPYWVDWLTLQFFGESGAALVLDDLELVLR